MSVERLHRYEYIPGLLKNVKYYAFTDTKLDVNDEYVARVRTDCHAL